MKKIYITIAHLLVILFCASAQSTRVCGTEDYNKNLVQHDAVYKKTQEALNAQSKAFMNNSRTAGSQAPVYIPVVFHIVYNTAAQNISTARILDQLQVLNDDFQRQNADTVNTPSAFLSCADASEVHFCLAERDPNGQPTTGISTVQTTVTSFTGASVMFTAQGGDDIWAAGSYLNIYVCNLANGMLGISQYPGGNPLTDGVILHYTCVGGPNAPGTGAPYNLGRIGTHNAGHWLNLNHFATNCTAVGCHPAQSAMPFGCPAYPDITCNGANAPDGTMFMNFMQGVDDNCMNLFTLDQVVRINAALTLPPRNTLALSQGCVPVGVNEMNTLLNTFNIFPNPSATGNIQLTFNTKHNASLECEIINMMGEKIYETQIPNIKFQFSNSHNLDVSFLAKGIYLVRVGDGERFENKKLVIE